MALSSSQYIKLPTGETVNAKRYLGKVLRYIMDNPGIRYKAPLDRVPGYLHIKRFLINNENLEQSKVWAYTGETVLCLKVYDHLDRFVLPTSEAQNTNTKGH